MNPELIAALERLVDPGARGDPMSVLRWTSKSTRKLAEELCAEGHEVGYRTVGKLLRQRGYRLQATRKTLEGKQHPDRDGQFRYLADQAKAFLDAGDPVISVDTKKKELVGAFANGGREFQPKGQPEKVNTYDFPSLAEGKAIPYGVYDLADNSGWVAVGVDHDTAAFAVATIRNWWQQVGRHRYPDSRRLLISADGGGSNSSRSRTWKAQLAKLAAETGLQITVCHLPPGTSKWNKIEHRLFSHISMNWRGRPLESHEVVVETIAATTTRQGLTVHAELDPGAYPTGIKVSNSEFKAVPLAAHEFHGEWTTLSSHSHPKPNATNLGASCLGVVSRAAVTMGFGCAGDFDRLVRGPVRLRPAAMGSAFDAEIGHLAFNDPREGPQSACGVGPADDLCDHTTHPRA